MLRTKLCSVFAIFCCTHVFAVTPTGPRKTEEKNHRRRLLFTQIGGTLEGLDANDQFGVALAISGNGETVAVGAPYSDPNGEADGGEVAVFDLDGGEWVQKGGYIVGLTGGDQTGWAVGLSSDGDTIAVGAQKADLNGGDSGKVTVLNFDGNAWLQVFNGEFAGEEAGDNSGGALAISSDGDVVLIGAVANTDGGTGAGHARAYRLDGSTWSLLGDDIDGDAANDFAGNAVAMSADGTVIAVAAMYNDADGTGAGTGQVRVFELDSGSAWSQRGSGINGDAAPDVFGHSVAMNSDGGVVVAGSTSNAGTTYVRVFEWSNGDWNQMGNDLDGGAGERFGYSVAIDGSGRILAVGAPFPATENGSVYLYEWNEVDDWEQIDVAQGDGEGDQFGWAVAMSSDGTTVVVGARNGDVNGAKTGYAKVFDTGLSSPTTPAPAGSPTTTTPAPSPGGSSFEQEVDVVLGGVTEPMSDSSTEAFQDATEDHVEQTLDGTVENPEATVTVTDQSVSDGRFLRTGSSRFLQSGLVVTFRLSVDYTGSLDDEPSELALQAFDGSNAAAFEALLRDSDAAFSDLTSIAATIVDDDVDDSEDSESESGGGSPSRINPFSRIGNPFD